MVEHAAHHKVNFYQSWIVLNLVKALPSERKAQRTEIISIWAGFVAGHFLYQLSGEEGCECFPRAAIFSFFI